MLTLINTNTMTPPIAPVGLEYLAQATIQAGTDVDILDLCLEEDRSTALADYFSRHSPDLIGLSLRNVDDCFWPSCRWFVPDVIDLIESLRSLTAAPIVVGGVGFSIFGAAIYDLLPVEYGIRGDGETALPALVQAMRRERDLCSVPGLIYRSAQGIQANAPAWPTDICLHSRRDLVDNRTYFKRAGQIGFETKRGCPRQCLYCPDPVAKGTLARLRSPQEVVQEIQALVDQGIHVLHTCDAEFNLPYDHALAVCHEIVRQGLAQTIQWYAYLSVVPFDAALASAMKRAGCVGIDFTTDAACATMLETYAQPYTKADIARAVTLCQAHGLIVMTDLLLGGPGETPETLAETIGFMKQIGPDGVGAGLGLRIYPGTPMVDHLRHQGPMGTNPNIKRKYEGPIDLRRPTFYVSDALGPEPARLIKDMIQGDPRFFEPMDESSVSRDHNYNDNETLLNAIDQGEQGAFWHILLKARV